MSLSIFFAEEASVSESFCSLMDSSLFFLIISFMIFLTLCLFLIPKWGIWGAAIAHSITAPLQLILAGYFVWKKIGLINIPIKISWE